MRVLFVSAALGLAVAMACGGDGPAAPTKEVKADDVRVEIARKTADRLGAEEDSLKKAMDDFGDAVNKFDLKAFETLEMTAEAGLKACERLEAGFKAAADKARAYQKAVKSLRAETEQAPEVYRQLALYYRAEAGKTKTPTFRDNYLKLADNSEAMAKLMEQRLKDLDALAGGTAPGKAAGPDDVDVVTFLEEGTKFFRDMAAFFKATPGALGAAERKKFKDDLKALAEQCNRFMGAFKTFSDKLKASAVSPGLKAEHDREQKAAAVRVPLEKARALRAEIERLEAEQKREWEVLEPTLRQLAAAGRQAQANQALANWLASWQRVERGYARKVIEAAPADTKPYVPDAALADGECYPVARPGVGGVGYARVTGRRPPRGVYVEAVEGTVRAGDFLLVKIG